jgi:hypothetical protein
MNLFGKKHKHIEVTEKSNDRTILVFGAPKAGVSSLAFKFIANRISYNNEELNETSEKKENPTSPRDIEKQKKVIETMEKFQDSVQFGSYSNKLEELMEQSEQLTKEITNLKIVLIF